MPTATYGDTALPADAGGFFTDPGRRTGPMAGRIAREAGTEALTGLAGLTDLTDRHRGDIRFTRERYAAEGTGPTVRVPGKTSGVSIKELYQLFPEGPAKTTTKIAGLPGPRGCI